MSSEAQVLFGGTGRVVSYGYDQYGYRTSTTYPDGSTVVSRTNTWDGRIDMLSRGGAGLVDYAYQGQRTAVRGYHTTAAVMAEYAYDHLGRVTDIAAGTGVDFHYDYVANENNIWKKRFDHRNGSPYNEYSYDDIDRLAGVTYLDSETEGFVMDDLGNRTGIQTLRGGGTDDYSVDALTNRYTSVGENSLAYDAAGNLTQDKDGYVYGYDYENRIVEIRSNADSAIAQMDYDTQGRRIRVYDAVARTETLYYYSDQWQVLAEYTPSGTQQAYYVYGNYIDEVLLMNRAGADVFYLHDHLYSPVALLAASGNVVERYEYDAYGKVSILSANYEHRTTSLYANAYYFTGREVDYLDNGSLPLQYNRHRYLSQYMGRWYSHDPLHYIDGLNLHEYVTSCPIKRFDPYGEDQDVDNTWKVLECRKQCGELYPGLWNWLERAGCHRRCDRGIDESMSYSIPNLKEILLSLVPSSPSIRYKIVSIPLPEASTPMGKIKLEMTGNITAKHCINKDGNRASQLDLNVTVKALACVGPSLKIPITKKVKPILPEAKIQECGPCKESRDSKVELTFTGKAGAIVTPAISKYIELYPNPGIGDFKVTVDIGAYCGAELCAEVKGSVTDSYVF